MQGQVMVVFFLVSVLLLCFPDAKQRPGDLANVHELTFPLRDLDDLATPNTLGPCYAGPENL